MKLFQSFLFNKTQWYHKCQLPTCSKKRIERKNVCRERLRERERGGRMLLFRVVKGHKDTSTLSLSHFLTAILSLFLTLWLCLALSHSLTLSWSFRSLSLSFSVNNCPYLTLRLSLCLSLSHFLTDSRWTLLFTLICWRDPLSPSRNLDEGDLGKGLIMRKLDFWMTREEWPIPVKGNVCLAFYFFKRLLLCRSKQIVLLTKCCDNLILNSLERTSFAVLPRQDLNEWSRDSAIRIWSGWFWFVRLFVGGNANCSFGCVV